MYNSLTERSFTQDNVDTEEVSSDKPWKSFNLVRFKGSCDTKVNRIKRTVISGIRIPGVNIFRGGD